MQAIQELIDPEGGLGIRLLPVRADLVINGCAAGSSAETVATKYLTAMNSKAIGCLAALLLVVGKIEANEKPAACVVYFSVVENDIVPAPQSISRMNKPQSSWYEKHGDREKYAGICYAEKGSPGSTDPPLYAIVWGVHVASEPYVFRYDTTLQANVGGSATKTDQYDNTGATAKKDYVADGWLAIWDPKTKEGKGNFVPIAPLRSQNSTDLNAASTSLLIEAMEQISQRENEKLAAAASERAPHKNGKGGKSRDERNGWTDITFVPMNNGQPVPTEPSSTTPQSSPDAAQPIAASPIRTTVPEYAPDNSSAVPSTVVVISTPPGADIFVDEDFVGNTPSTINVTVGRHVITVKKSGFQNWARIVNFSGGQIALNAELAGGPNEIRTADPPTIPDNTKESAAAGVSANSSEKRVGWIGVSTKNGSRGALVIKVTAKGPAAQAGIHVGDIILSLDGRRIKGKDLDTEVAALKPGTRVPVDYTRGPTAHEVWITVGSQN